MLSGRGRDSFYSPWAGLSPGCRQACRAHSPADLRPCRMSAGILHGPALYTIEIRPSAPRVPSSLSRISPQNNGQSCGCRKQHVFSGSFHIAASVENRVPKGRVAQERMALHTVCTRVSETVYRTMKNPSDGPPGRPKQNGDIGQAHCLEAPPAGLFL